jgi:hypothetical protein
MSSANKGNVVIAGDTVYAGIDEDDRCEVHNALVIEFRDPANFRRAIRTGWAAFTVFESENDHDRITHAPGD